MEKFTTSIRKKYQQNLINKEKQWPPRHTEELIRLVLVENDYVHQNSRSKQTRAPIKYEDLFQMNRKRKAGRATKILVEGDAGIGKTTLCTTIAEDWASMKLFQQFKLLLLLPLRETLVSTASSLTKLLRLLHSSESTCRSIASVLEEDEGEDVLIVADGWDELAKSKRQEGTFLYNLLFGKILPFASVLLTSRHTASISLHRDPRFHYFVEICGFSSDNIREYIFSEFDDNKDIAVRLLEQLESNPLVESICSIPLNCAIICHLWRTLKENDLPTTMTNLYTKIILNVILRHIQKRPAYKNTFSLPNLYALPATLQQSWWLLCKFAFQTLARDQLVFTEEELANFFPQGLSLDENILCFGMLQSTESILDIGCGLTFHFPHRTFQEFLAALYIVELPIDAEINGHITITNSPLYYRFFFGLSFHIGNSIIKQTDDKRTDLLLAAKSIIECLSILIYQRHQHEYLPLLLHCSFEADNRYIYNKVVNCIIVPKKRSVLRSNSYMSLDIHTSKYTAYDCTALIHLFANTNKCGTLEISMIDFSECGIRDKQVVALGDALASKHGKLLVNILSLSKNKLTWESLQYLFNRASAAFQTLEELWLYNIDTIADPIVLSDTLSIIHCPKLRSLDLSNNVLGVAGVKAVGRLVSDLTQHERNFELYLNEIQLGDEGLKVFTQALDGKCHIRRLELQKNDIHIDGVTCLAEVIYCGKLILGEVEFEHPLFALGEMWGLDLTGNPLGTEGLMAIGRILNCSGYFFGSLLLVDCKLTHTVNVHSSLQCIQEFCQMIPKLLVTSNITRLYLDNNRFTGDLSDILTRFIFLCPWLILLRTCSCDITSDDLRRILVRLSSLKYTGVICRWHLLDNKIDDEGVTILLQHLHSLFPEAEAITVGVIQHDSADDAKQSFISDDMLKKLQEELAKLKEVRDARMARLAKEVSEKWGSTEPENHNTDKSSPSHESSEVPSDISISLPPCDRAAQNFMEQYTTAATVTVVPSSTCRTTTLTKSNQYEHSSSLLDVEIKDLDQYVLCPLNQSQDSLGSTCIRQSADQCLSSLFNKIIDSENGGVSKHLGQIADKMHEWEGTVAENLGLTKADIAAIKTKYPINLKLQARDALEKWKQSVGSKATYGELIQVFEYANHKDYASHVRKLCYEKRDAG